MLGSVCMRQVKLVSLILRTVVMVMTNEETLILIIDIHDTIYVTHFNLSFEGVISTGDRWYGNHTPLGESHVMQLFMFTINLTIFFYNNWDGKLILILILNWIYHLHYSSTYY